LAQALTINQNISQNAPCGVAKPCRVARFAWQLRSGTAKRATAEPPTVARAQVHLRGQSTQCWRASASALQPGFVLRLAWGALVQQRIRWSER
jgi:hypothetical protein